MYLRHLIQTEYTWIDTDQVLRKEVGLKVSQSAEFLSARSAPVERRAREGSSSADGADFSRAKTKGAENLGESWVVHN